MRLLILLLMAGCTHPRTAPESMQYCVGKIYGMESVIMICTDDPKKLPGVEQKPNVKI